MSESTHTACRKAATSMAPDIIVPGKTTSFRELLLSPVDSRSDADRFQQLQQRARSLGEQQQHILDRAVELEIIGADEAERCASTSASKQSVASPASRRSKAGNQRKPMMGSKRSQPRHQEGSDDTAASRLEHSSHSSTRKSGRKPVPSSKLVDAAPAAQPAKPEPESDDTHWQDGHDIAERDQQHASRSIPPPWLLPTEPAGYFKPAAAPAPYAYPPHHHQPPCVPGYDAMAPHMRDQGAMHPYHSYPTDLPAVPASMPMTLAHHHHHHHQWQPPMPAAWPAMPPMAAKGPCY